MSEEITSAEALVKVLEELGVDTIFGYPGGANLPIYDALRESNIKHILTRHEQGAAFMAEGYGRVAGKPGVCLATSGPGATNLVTGLADALLDSTPVVALTGQIVTGMVGSDAFQEVDCFNTTMPVTKHNEMVMDPEEVVPATRAAFHIANTGRKGPVLLDLPKDVLLTKGNYDLKKTRDLKGYQPTLQGHIGQIKKALKALKKAERPLLLIGGGVSIGNAVSEFLEFAKLTKIPVLRTLMGKGVMGENDEQYLGMIGSHGNVEANKVVNKADVIFAVGTRFGDRATMNSEKFAKNAKIIQLDIDPAEIGKIVPIDIPIVGDVKEVLGAMLDEVKKKPLGIEELWVSSKDRKSALTTSHNASLLEIIFAELSKYDHPLHVTTDVGRHQMWATHHITNEKHLPILTSGGLGTMGFGLPAAIGAWYADKSKPTVNLTGDGSFMMNLQEFAVAVEHDVPLVVILVNDSRLGMIRELQDSAYDKRYTAHDFQKSIDFPKMAESMGGVGINVTVHNQVGPSIIQAIESGKPTIINFDLEKLARSYNLHVNSAAS